MRHQLSRDDRSTTFFRAVVIAAVANVLVAVPARPQAATWTTGDGSSAYYLLGPVGIGTSAPENKLHLQSGGPNGYTYLEVRNYTTSVGYPPGLNMSQSNSNTVGVLATTVNGQYLAEWSFRGVDSGPTAFRQAAIMDVFQDGASLSTGVPGSFNFMTGDGGAQGPVSRLVIRASGNVGIGTTVPTSKLHVVGSAAIVGDLSVTGNIAAKYQDIAEWVPSSTDLEPGMVVVLNPDKSNEVMASQQPYDTRVAGVVSQQPGLVLGEASESKEKIATMGRVRVRVDATKNPIQVGDLLVTSDEAGVAMRSVPVNLGGTKIHRPGTIVGKALEPLASGKAEILVLLTLQ